MVHASLSHALAALLLGLSVTGLRILSRVDHNALGTPWSSVVRVTDYLTMALLCTATFGPIALVALHGEPGWDWAVLGGCLLIWWVILDALIADHRRVLWTIAAFAAAWIPVALLAPSLRTLAFLAETLALVALSVSLFSLVRSMRGVPNQYRVIDVEPSDSRL